MNAAAKTVLIVCATALCLTAQTLAPQARRYREAPSPARRAALVRYAAEHPKDVNGALALLVLGVAAVGQADFPEAVRRLEAAQPRLPQLADYTSYYLGLARAGLGEDNAAAKLLESVLPPSPLAGKSALAAAKAYLAADEPLRAIAAIQSQYPLVPQPGADLLLANAAADAGSLVSASLYAQRVYFTYPASKEAETAGPLLTRLREKLGAQYPPPAPETLLGRAAKWMDARNYQRARQEYESLAADLDGRWRELAQVRAGGARYQSGPARAALIYLQGLSPESPEVDAERLYYLVQCARSVNDAGSMKTSLEEMRLRHPGSEWRLEALFSAGNYQLLRHGPEEYTPFFRACYEDFPQSGRAEYCHWKVAWDTYLARRSDAAEMLREHLKRFPQAEKSAAALYFLGRLSEASGAAEEARASYRQIVQRFPGSYYMDLAETRLGGPQSGKSAPLDFEPDAAARPAIARSRLLSSAGLFDLAEAELRYVARTSATPQVLALEAARQASLRDAPDDGLRHIKGAFPAYLGTPLDAAPPEFWRLAFPIPYRASLQQNARVRGLDLYLLAGLIRQESEFSVRAVSRAGARGLMQVMPSTGGELARRLRMGGFRASSLFVADVNIRLGSYHFRNLVDEFQGSVEAALAAYNGGQQRVLEWLSWATYREPAEFVETIPITETRGYVQAVLRNAYIYRRLYAPR